MAKKQKCTITGRRPSEPNSQNVGPPSTTLGRQLRKVFRDCALLPDVRLSVPLVGVEVPDAKFFEPHEPTFLQHMYPYKKQLVVDCGCGSGHVTELLRAHGYDVLPVDVIARPSQPKDTVPCDVLTLPLQSDMVFMLARPCHGSWTHELIARARKHKLPMIYIGLRGNVDDDLGTARKKFFSLYPVGKSDEIMYVSSWPTLLDGLYPLPFHCYQHSCGHSGGDMDEYPKPHHRRFPGPVLRAVRVTITSWIGYAAGAKHYHVSLREEDNPIWNSKGKAWVKPWKDSEGNGEFTTFATISLEKAKERSLKEFKKLFSDETHELIDEATYEPATWRYVKEGD